MLNGSQHGHKQNSPYAGTSSAYPTVPSECSAVTIEWCDTDQGGNLLIGKCTEFWQIGQQGIDDLSPDPRYGEQDFAPTQAKMIQDYLIRVGERIQAISEEDNE